MLTSFTSAASNHIPMTLSCSTNIPCSQVFRFNNYWTMYHDYLPLVTRSWESVQSAYPGLPANKHLTLCLKRTRADLKSWAKNLRRLDELLANCKVAFAMLSKIEEHRSLCHVEFALCELVQTSSRRQSACIAAYWKQRGKVKWCILGDENTKYHHMCATIRIRNALI